MDRVLFAPRELPPLPPDVTQDRPRYTAWVRAREVERVRHEARARHPHLAVVLLVTGEPLDAVHRTLLSLRMQTSGQWSLIVAMEAPRLTEVGAVMRHDLPRRWQGRVCTVVVAADTAAPGLLQAALVRRKRPAPVAFVFPGDVWAADAISLLGMALTPDGVVYADEDRIGQEGLEAPRLKPDYSPDFLISSAYIGRPLALGAQLVSNLVGLGASDTRGLEYECTLVACAAAGSVTHLSEVLCHRSSKTEVEPGPDSAVVQRALEQRNESAQVASSRVTGSLHLAWPVPDQTTTSVIIAFRDQPQFLRTCVDSVRRTGGDHLEFVLVDNGTTDPETLTLLEGLAERPEVRVVHDPRPFNWASLNNAGAAHAGGEVLLFLNNDVEARRAGWLDALAGHALRPDVGAVGARLMYPDGRLQHCGVVVGLGGAAGHLLAGLPEGSRGYLGMATATRECSAVTGACLATRREVFESLGGFDETLGVDLNDIDYCLRAGARGLRTVFEPWAELVHHESPSRGTAGGVGDIVRFVERWRSYIIEGDGYLNRHLTRTNPSCGLVGAGEEDLWNTWYSTLKRQ